jgi:amino acid transporter
MSEEKDDSSQVGNDNGYIESVAGHPTPPKNRYHFDQSDLDRVQRRLKQRHVQMFVLFFLCIHLLRLSLFNFTGSR